MYGNDLKALYAFDAKTVVKVSPKCVFSTGVTRGKVYRVDETFDHTLFIGASCAFGVFDGVHRGS